MLLHTVNCKDILTAISKPTAKKLIKSAYFRAGFVKLQTSLLGFILIIVAHVKSCMFGYRKKFKE